LNQNQVVKVIIEQWIRRSGFVIVGMILIIILDCMQVFKQYITNGVIGDISFYRAYLLILGFIFLQGMIQSYHDYSGYLGIRAQRKEYLMYMLLIGVIGTIGLMIVIFDLDIVARKCIGIVIYHKWQAIDSGHNKMEELYTSIKFLWRTGILLYGIGFFTGALFYRLRKVVALALIISVPVIVMGIVILEITVQNPITKSLFNLISVLIVPALEGRRQLTYGGVLIGGAILLLRHAPTNRYKHDLMQDFYRRMDE